MGSAFLLFQKDFKHIKKLGFWCLKRKNATGNGEFDFSALWQQAHRRNIIPSEWEHRLRISNSCLPRFRAWSPNNSK